jgi:drug/metabolite transporter (DMT)-like permease
VIGASVPVLFELLRRNPPGALQFAGFLLALLGIWLVAQTPGKNSPSQQSGFWLAAIAGLGFGGFFVLIRQASGGVFALLTLSKASGLALAMIVLWLRREALPGVGSNPMALFAGVLDAGGNVFYLVATRYTRLDVAAVLSALYPAVTVLLASLLTQEAVSRKQWAGVSACLAAVMLILI